MATVPSFWVQSAAAKEISMSQIDSSQRRRLLQTLATSGFDLRASLPLSVLPPNLRKSLPKPLISKASVLLLGASAQRFWQQIIDSHQGQSPSADAAVFATETKERHPVDTFTQSRIQAVMEHVCPTVNYALLFPAPDAGSRKTGIPPETRSSSPRSAEVVPLQTLGRLAGWHHASPLGIGLHPEKGLWFAYRAVLVLADGTGLDTTATSRQPRQAIPTEQKDVDQKELWSICERCSDKPCLSACPADALRFAEAPQMESCSRYRLAETSACKETCLARLACPVGLEHRYETQQIAYHYRYSLLQMRQTVD